MPLMKWTPIFGMANIPPFESGEPKEVALLDAATGAIETEDPDRRKWSEPDDGELAEHRRKHFRPKRRFTTIGDGLGLPGAIVPIPDHAAEKQA